MELPGGDPKDVLNKVSVELKTKSDECGMGAVDAFVDNLDQLKEMVEKGPAGLIEEMQKQFAGVKDKIDQLMEDPTSLAPSGSALVNCAAWYGKSVCKKLKAYNEDVNLMIEGMKALM